MKNKIIQHLKTEHKNDVDQLFATGNEQESRTFNDFKSSLISQQLKQSLLRYDSYEQTDKIWNKVNEEISIGIFDQFEIELNDGSFEYQNNNTCLLYTSDAADDR